MSDEEGMDRSERRRYPQPEPKWAAGPVEPHTPAPTSGAVLAGQLRHAYARGREDGYWGRSFDSGVQAFEDPDVRLSYGNGYCAGETDKAMFAC